LVDGPFGVPPSTAREISVVVWSWAYAGAAAAKAASSDRAAAWRQVVRFMGMSLCQRAVDRAVLVR
jgi:hypothetical protein